MNWCQCDNQCLVSEASVIIHPYIHRKEWGNNVPICRTPLDTLMASELVPFNVAFTLCLLYISNTIIKITLDICLSSNRWNIDLIKSLCGIQSTRRHAAASRGLVRNGPVHGSNARHRWVIEGTFQITSYLVVAISIHYNYIQHFTKSWRQSDTTVIHIQSIPIDL